MAETDTSPHGRRKNTLFCPRCGHESATDGDWRVRATAAGAVYACPVCRVAVTERPGADGRPSERDAGGDGLISAWLRVGVAWTTWLWLPGEDGCQRPG